MLCNTVSGMAAQEFASCLRQILSPFHDLSFRNAYNSMIDAWNKLPVFQYGLPEYWIKSCDRLVQIEGIIAEVRGGDLLKDPTASRPESMHSTAFDQDLIAWAERDFTMIELYRQISP